MQLSELVHSEYAHLNNLFFNTAYFGPSPYRAKKRVLQSLDKELNPAFYDYHTWFGNSERVRQKLANLINVPVDNITHSTSSSDVINIVANGFDFKEGDRVASINKEYPSNVLPWMLAEKHTPVTLDLMELGKNIVPTSTWLEKHLHPKTKIFNISHVQFDSGKRIDLIDLGKFLKNRDILFVVDTTQSLGGMPLTDEELQYIDVVACSSYKWMLGPYGHAFGVFSEKAQNLIHHKTANWILSPNSRNVYGLLDYTTDTIKGARKYDRGQASNMLAMACFEAGVEFLTEVGLSTIQKHNQSLRDFFLDNFPRKKYELLVNKEHMGNIVSIKCIGPDPIELEGVLKSRNIDVSVREGKLRLSFHLFNTISQVEELVAALDQ
jgi:cysteine desulfurase / selenocysteine lyase